VSKWDLTDWKSAMLLVKTLVPFLVLRNSAFSLATTCSCFCNRIRLVVDVRIITGGLPVLLGTAFSFEFASLTEASVSMSAAVREAKKFRVTTSLEGGGMFKAGDVLFRTAAFLEFPSVSSGACRFRLRTSGKPSSSVVFCPVAFGKLVWSARVFDLCRACNSSEVTA
jgi:hypothetical protein